MPDLAFVHSPLDRCGNRRNEPGFVEKLRSRPDTRFVQIKGDTVRMAGQSLFLQRDESATELLFLGRDAGGIGWFASASADGGPDFQPIRGLMVSGQLPREELSILAQARSLVHWHETHGFCAKCGAKSVLADEGYRRRCHSCNSDHFPRTDPVVIMVVQASGKLLLGRQVSWPPGMLSALAGFVEPGETLEEAVRREVNEEAGLKVGAVRYITSQPWPFPASLMIGCLCEALSEDIDVDGNELEMARWFTDQEVRQMLAGEHPEGFRATNPYAIAHRLIREAIGAL